jgi:predicted phage-related endonuclease
MNAPSTALAIIPVAEYDRRRFIGGSDAAAILGVGATYDGEQQTPYTVFLKKTAEEPEQISDEKRQFFQNRKDMEPIIAKRLAREYGVVVTKLSLDETPNRYQDPDYRWMAAEVDFEFLMTPEVRAHFPEREDFCAIPDGTLLNGEIKTAHSMTRGRFGEEGTEDLPIEYASQNMWGLGVTRRPACLTGVLFGIDDLVCYPVMADQETIGGMRERVVIFREEYWMKGIPPPAINVDDVTKMYAGFNGRPVELSDEAYEALRSLDTVRKTIATFEGDAIELQWRVARCVALQWGAELAANKDNKPILAATENAFLLYAGDQAGSWNRQSRKGIDTTRLKKEEPEIAAAYATESQFRVMRTKQPKG